MKWGAISVPDAQEYLPDKTGKLTIEAPLSLTCTVSADYNFTVWLEAPRKPQYARITGGMDFPYPSLCSAV